MPKQTHDRQLGTLVLVIIGAIVFVPVLFMSFGMMGHGPTMGGMWGGSMWGNETVPVWLLAVSFVVRLLFLVALGIGGYLVYRIVVGESSADGALEELRLAYARGELTDEEYENRRERLERDS